MGDSNPCSELKMVLFNAWQEILKRAPPKTLGKCMCVCKTWYTLIKSPNFITTHALIQSKNQTQLILFRNFTKPPKKSGKESYFIFSDPQNGPLKTHLSFPCPFNSRMYFRVVGVVNGVICLSDDRFGYAYTIILWNPLICKFVEVPQPRATFDAIGVYMFTLGFGYDSVRDDYKVVRVSYVQDKEGLDGTPPLVEVYSVKEGVWRWVKADNVVYCMVQIEWSQCFLRGCVHWVSFDKRDYDGGFKSNWLLLFDVEQEKFKRMKVPSELMEVCPVRLGVFEFKGMLALRYHHLGGGMMGGLERFDMWVKERYNDGKSWTKMFSIDGDSGIERVLHLRGNGEMVAFSKKGELVCYDPETKQMVGLEGDGKYGSYYFCSFSESLVFLEEDSPAVSYEEDHSYSANAEMVEETSSDSDQEDEDGLFDAEMRLFMRGPFQLFYQMIKFRREF